MMFSCGEGAARWLERWRALSIVAARHSIRPGQRDFDREKEPVWARGAALGRRVGCPHRRTRRSTSSDGRIEFSHLSFHVWLTGRRVDYSSIVGAQFAAVGFVVVSPISHNAGAEESVGRLSVGSIGNASCVVKSEYLYTDTVLVALRLLDCYL